MKPTQEQIKRFWEWCGFEKDGDWYENDDELLFIPEGYADIDLNNLFRYAVPKVMSILKEQYPDGIDWRHAILKIFYEWLVEVLDDKDPALALFWAIYEVVKK